jgi:DNA-binding FadR family transcriptional regulator
MTNTLIVRQPLNDEIISRLKGLIEAGHLKPGDRLATEQELAAQFGVSRLSIREALRALRYLGIVHSSPRRGLTVGKLDLQRLGECLDFHAVVSRYPDEQLLKARLALEVGVLPLVMKKMQEDPGIYDRIYAITAKPGVTTDPDIYLHADLEFHSALVEAADIAPLNVFSELLRAFFVRFREQVVGSKADRETGTRLHRRIITALRDGHLDKAQEIVLKSFQTYEKKRDASL